MPFLHQGDANETVETRIMTAWGAFQLQHQQLLAAGVHERTVAAHLANAIKAEFPHWDVDVEYDRAMDAPKRIAGRGQKPLRVVPDIIIHRRGSSRNLLVIEIKKYGAPGQEHDREKLTNLTLAPPMGLGYRWGLQLVLPRRGQSQPVLRWFTNGVPLTEQPFNSARIRDRQ